MDQLIYAVENTNHKRQNNDADDEKISIENPVEKGMTIGAKPTLHTRKKSKTINTDIKENPQTNSTNIHGKYIVYIHRCKVFVGNLFINR